MRRPPLVDIAIAAALTLAGQLNLWLGFDGYYPGGPRALNVLLTLVGGVIGFILSRFVLQAITGSGWFPYAQFHLNYRIFLAGLGLAIFFGLMSGVYPAWKMSRLHPVQALKGGVR